MNNIKMFHKAFLEIEDEGLKQKVYVDFLNQLQEEMSAGNNKSQSMICCLIILESVLGESSSLSKVQFSYAHALVCLVKHEGLQTFDSGSK
jgi:hypothetical protein